MKHIEKANLFFNKVSSFKPSKKEVKTAYKGVDDDYLDYIIEQHNLKIIDNGIIKEYETFFEYLFFNSNISEKDMWGHFSFEYPKKIDLHQIFGNIFFESTIYFAINLESTIFYTEKTKKVYYCDVDYDYFYEICIHLDIFLNILVEYFSMYVNSVFRDKIYNYEKEVAKFIDLSQAPESEHFYRLLLYSICSH